MTQSPSRSKSHDRPGRGRGASSPEATRQRLPCNCHVRRPRDGASGQTQPCVVGFPAFSSVRELLACSGSPPQKEPGSLTAARKSGDISLDCSSNKAEPPAEKPASPSGPAPTLVPPPVGYTSRDRATRLPRKPWATLNRGSPVAPGRDGGRGLPSDLAAWKATPQVGSDGAELARRGRLYGLPLLLESGNGRCVVSTEVNPARTSCFGVSGRPRAAFESLKGESRGDRAVGYRQL